MPFSYTNFQNKISLPGKSDGTFGQKQWEIRGGGGGSNRKFGQKQWEFRKKQWEIRAKGIIFARNICRRFQSFLIAFAQIFAIAFARISIAFALISHCFFPKFGQKQLEILAKAMEKFVQKQWENSEIKRWDIFRANITEVLGNFTDWHIIFKIYFLDQIKILKDLAWNSQYTYKINIVF